MPEKQQKTSENDVFSKVFAVDSIFIHETWQTATYCLILPHSDRCATTICLIGKFQGKKIGDCKPMSAIAFLLLCSFYRYGLCYSTFEVEVQSVIIPYHDYVHE